MDVFKGARWRFVVRDNGVGFDIHQGHGPSHVGMKIMRERAAGIGAQVTFASVPGHGSSATLSLPTHPTTGHGAGGQALKQDSLAGLEQEA